MDASWLPALFGLTALSSYLSVASQTTFVVEKPTLTAVVFVLTSGLSLLATTRSTKYHHHRSKSDDESFNGSYLRQTERKPSIRGFKSLLSLLGVDTIDHSTQLLLVVLVTALVSRIQLTCFLIQHVECTASSFQSILPAAVALIGRVLLRWQPKSPGDSKGEQQLHAKPGRRQALQYGGWHIGTTILISFSAVAAVRAYEAPRSSYICAASTPHIWMTPLLQHITILVDVTIVLCVSLLLPQDLTNSHDGATQRPVRIIALSTLGAATIVTFVAVLRTLFLRSGLPNVGGLPAIYLVSLAKMTLLISAFTLSAIQVLRRCGLLLTTVLPVAVAVATSTAASVISSGEDPLPTSNTPYSSFLAMAAMLLTLMGFLRIEQHRLVELYTVSRRSINRAFSLLYLGAIAFLICHAHDCINTKTPPSSHDPSIKTDLARLKHLAYTTGANESITIQLAVAEYNNRYSRYPPPGFDAWYKYARARQSVVIDDFDSMWQDLRPFYAIDPAEIRTRTVDLISDPHNDIAGVSIRDGQAHAGPNIATKHQTMVEGIVQMIEKFAKHLPDMDLAFNLNDANRVVVPFERMDYLRHMSEPPVDRPKPQNKYQPGRSSHWPRLSAESRNTNIMAELNANDNVYRYATAGCPPSSNARRHHFWKVASSYKHNMTIDVCGQPDLQYMHGAYSAPPVFKATHKLYPIFSQSRAPGFNDILYPSPWDYMDKTIDAPSKHSPDLPWSEKAPDLFWRGTTTEGVSRGEGRAKWQGMLTQRFVHMSNNIKGSSLPAIVQTGFDPPAYLSVPAEDITQLIKTDVRIEGDIAKCSAVDCDVQRWEFAPLPNMTDLGDHWSHKYLLDMDGDRKLSRFLPFLQSKSLPFRASIMQEWWHDRVQPWLHYVPLDIRGTDFWTTLAWYAGIDGTVEGRRVEMNNHDDEAELIASTGKQWAEVALRKEDMEIYFFRLLLEWARITDDWRDDIGFDGSSE